MWQYCSQTLHSLTCVNSVQQTWTRCLVGTGGHLDPAQSCTASWPCSVTISYNDKFCFVGLGGFEVTACVKDRSYLFFIYFKFVYRCCLQMLYKHFIIPTFLSIPLLSKLFSSLLTLGFFIFHSEVKKPV